MDPTEKDDLGQLWEKNDANDNKYVMLIVTGYLSTFPKNHDPKYTQYIPNISKNLKQFNLKNVMCLTTTDRL